MNQFSISRLLLALLALPGLFLFSQCDPDEVDPIDTGEDPQTLSCNAYLVDEFNALPVEDLSAVENADVLFLREEEKLARDVYLLSKSLYTLPIFDNISQSEQCHMDHVALLLDRYELFDPTTGKAEGEFLDPALQTLYDDLAAQSQTDLVGALTAGALIEETDIVDLKEAIDAADNQDVILVYERLLQGSGNHLRAYFKNLQNQGVEYEPQVLSQAEFDAIIDGNQP
ncbi:MAG: DUF2202 domain-containing protein [Saprospiraceae bacterium]|nr:DUF2202 domain-containing protein [Saprospiraceae bacterium]